MTSLPRNKTRKLLDLFSGRFGWSKAFAAKGWECVGIDLVEPPEIPAGCTFIKADILTITPEWVREQGFDFGVASSPCENFSLFQIRNFHPNPKYPALGIELFNHARWLFNEAKLPHVLENVRAAQDFVGQSVNHAGSFHLWGDSVPAFLPKGLTKGMKMDRKWCQELGGHGTAKRDSQTAGFATIPEELASVIAEGAERILECKDNRPRQEEFC